LLFQIRTEEKERGPRLLWIEQETLQARPWYFN